MLKRIIEFSVKQKFIALSLVVLMGITGFMALRNIPINSLPDVTPVQVLVITKAGRYSPFDVEKLVSFPIENAMNGLPDVKQVRSISQFGLSAVTIEFKENSDIFFVRQLVSQRLQSIVDELPDGVSAPQLGPISTAMGEIYQYQVVGPSYSLTELRSIQDWLIAPQLKTIKGVTEINSFGGYVRQVDIEVLPGKLRQYGIGLDDVFNAINDNNAVSGGNYLTYNREQYIVRGVGMIESLNDIENIIVRNIDGNPVYIRNIAVVKEGKQIRQGAVTRDGNGEIVTGIVMMLRGENGRKVIQSIETKIAEVNQSLPDGVKIEKFYDQSDLISRTTNTLSKNLIEGGLLVIIVLLILLGDFRGALIVALVIPLSMLFAFIGMKELGLAANLMSLGAIDFGMIVDGSVVMIENIIHRRQKEPDVPKNKLVISAAKEVAKPIFFGVLIILVVYIPVMTFSGMEGILYRPMAITVSLAVFGSLLLALVFIPAMMSIRLFKRKKTKKHKENWLIKRLRPLYQKVLGRTIERKWTTVGIALGVFVLSLFFMTRMGTEFLPELDEGSILIEEVRMPSVTLEESVEKANELAGNLVRNIPEIESVVPKTGRSDLANDWMGVHQTDVWVLLKPEDEWRKGMTKADIEKEIEPYLVNEPGLSYNFTQPIAMRVDELTSGVKSDLAVVIYGEDLDSLSVISKRIAAKLPDIPGTDNFYVDQPVGQPYFTIEADRQALAGFGLNVSDVQNVIEAGIGGKTISELYEGQRRYNIQLRFPEALRSNFSQISQIPVQLPDGNGFVPLSRVTKISAQEGPREIQRENGWRRLIVGINIKDTDMGTYVADLKQVVNNETYIPSGYFLHYGGSFENQQRAMNHLILIVPLVLFLIIGLLYINFNKLSYALLVFLNLPLALSGGVFLLYARGMYLSVSASIGFIALFGVAVLNGIVLVSHLNELRKSVVTLPDLRKSVMQGATDRLRPVLMTALVASLGFVPMAFNTGPGSEVQSPLATVVIGGLVTSTLLTLFVLPTIYYWMEKRFLKFHSYESVSSDK